MARDNRAFARFNKIGLDRDGNPDPDDLRLAWAAVYGPSSSPRADTGPHVHGIHHGPGLC